MRFLLLPLYGIGRPPPVNVLRRGVKGLALPAQIPTSFIFRKCRWCGGVLVSPLFPTLAQTAAFFLCGGGGLFFFFFFVGFGGFWLRVFGFGFFFVLCWGCGFVVFFFCVLWERSRQYFPRHISCRAPCAPPSFRLFFTLLPLMSARNDSELFLTV